MEKKYETVKLFYTIHKYSSYSSDYLPEKIMVNNPTDELSRWFTDSTTSSQYIMLRLSTPAIAETIMFGKYVKGHVSDLKKFQVFGGMDEDNLSLLLTSGLKKDNVPETFHLRHRTTEGLYLPVTYVKIVPLQSWGPAYNYAVWYVELQGKNHDELMSYVIDTYSLRKEEESVRLLLKHLRRRNYKGAFEALSRETGVSLEGPLQDRLWHALVENGDYEECEQIVEKAIAEGELDWYMSWQQYKPVWRQLSPCSLSVQAKLTSSSEAKDESMSVDNSEETDSSDAPRLRPGPRGGHQLIIDPDTGTLYLFGGWNGHQDLDDLWSFNTITEKWTLLCRHTAEVGGPSPRSCHKMVLDPVDRRLYTLGRYLDTADRVPDNMNSDLYTYDIGSNTWSKVCSDTHDAGGPRLVFDHQLCIDADARVIYAFGGRMLLTKADEAAEQQYSGLYAYYITSGTWQLIETPDLTPRVSHSMVFHPEERKLYVVGGVRNKEQLVELCAWDVPRRRAAPLCRRARAAPPPHAGYTQRATLLPARAQLYILSGMSKEKDKRVYNTLWMLDMKHWNWTCLYRNGCSVADEPQPRYAHQLVLDTKTETHYLFGGNPGQSGNNIRLDDLWSLKLEKPSADAVRSELRVMVREARYRELACRPDAGNEALEYLRNDLFSVLDHSDTEQVSRFQKLATVLFSGGGRDQLTRARSLTPARARALARRKALPPAKHTLNLLAALSVVLSDDHEIPANCHQFEEVTAPITDTWDVGDDDVTTDPPEWALRNERIQLYDEICRYFRPSVVPPLADVSDLVVL